MKTRAKVITDLQHYHCRARAGDKGYIDGYVRGGDNVPYAVFISDVRADIEMIPLQSLKVISQED